VVLSGFVFSAATPFPGWAALVPVGGAAAVIAVNGRGRGPAPAQLLARGPFQWLGDLSYSLYLWHWPVVVLASWRLGPVLDWPARAGVLVLSVALAAATKSLVEDRFRVTPRRAPLRSTYVRAVAATAAVAVVAGGMLVLVGRTEAGAQRRLAAAVQNPGPCFGAASLVRRGACPQASPGRVVPDPVIAEDDRTRLYDDDCWENPPFAGTASCTYGAADAPLSIALVGNSHAGHWFAAVEAIAAERGAKVTTFVAAGCTVTAARLVWETPERADGCQQWGRRVVEETSSDRYDLIITSEIATRMVEGGSPANRQADLRSGYLGVLRQWAAAGKHVLVLRDTPQVPASQWSPPECVALLHEDLTTCGGDRRRWLRPDSLVDAAKVMKSDLVSVVDLTSRFCTAQCSAVVGGVLVFYDHHHMTDTFARTLVPDLRPRIFAALEQSQRP